MYPAGDGCDLLSLPQAESGLTKIMNHFKRIKEGVCVNYNAATLLSLARIVSVHRETWKFGKQTTRRPQQHFHTR